MSVTKSAFVSLLVAASLAACSSEPAETPAPAAMPEVDLEALAVPQASTELDGVLAAGQLSPAQMDALHAAGYRSFISLRVADERGAGWEEEHAETNGIRFVRMPIAGKADIDEPHARELANLMDDEEKPMVVYCGSSNRVGALFGLMAYHVDGQSAEDAYEFGKASGVTSLDPVFRDQLGL